MKIISLSLCNFMPYKGDTKIEFPQDDQRNVMIIFGENMRGKTSLLNSIRWCLYGKALGRHLRELPLHELHNKEAASQGDWSMEVRLEFESDGHFFSLLRRATKRATVAVPSRPEDFQVEVVLQKDRFAINGNLVEGEINRIAPEQVSRFFLFDGELLQEYEELLVEGSEQGKGIKAAIEQVLGVPTLINGRLDAGSVLRAAQRQQSRDLAHVAGLEGQAQKQTGLQVRVEAHEEDLRTLNDRLTKVKASRDLLDDDLQKLDSVHRSKIKLDAASARIKEVIQQQDAMNSNRLMLMKEAWKDLLQAKLAAKLGHLKDEERKVRDAAQRRSGLESKAQNLRDLLSNATCPTCEQEFDVAHRDNKGAQLGAIEVALAATDFDARQNDAVAHDIASVEKLMSVGVSHKVSAIDQEITRRDIELTKLENEVETLQVEIRGYDTAEIARKRVLRDGYLKDEGKLGNEIDLVKGKIDGVTKELAMLARALQNIPQARASRSTEIVKVATALEKVFSESVEKLRERLRGSVQQLASDAFRSLTTQKTYQGLEINKNYGLRIVDDGGSQVTIRSAGAEQIVALSLIDGLARTGRTAGPVVMDTPFGRLDLQHRDNILRYLPTTTSQLVLLVHGGEIRRPDDLQPIASRIGAAYEIEEVNSRHSKIRLVTA